MSAGTLTLANNSDAVTGNGTTFTTELGAGDFIVVTVGGVPYTLPVKSVTSNTSLTLVSNFTGPAQSGAAWSAVPRTALNMVTAALVVQSAEALRGLNYDKQNWQAVFSGSENITVMLPDGSKYPGPSWKYLADNMVTKTGGAVPVAEGGTGSTTAAGARKNLELDNVATTTDGAVPINQGGTGATTAATARTKLGLDNVATKSGGAVPVNQGGTGSLNANDASGNLTFHTVFPTEPVTGSVDMNTLIGVSRSAGMTYRIQNGSTFTNFPTDPYGGAGYAWGALVTNKITIGSSAQCVQTYYADNVSDMMFRVNYSGTWKAWVAVLTNKNTTVDSNGFIKRASPIVQVYGDGTSQTNAESDGATVTREDIGVYRISGVLGMNSDRSWGGNGGGIELPKDVNGQPRVWVDYDVDADGSIVIRTYHRTHPDAPEFARNLIGTKDDAGIFTETVQNGEPIDIPEDVFISVRVEMPADSIWNKKQAEEALKQEQGS